VHFRGWRPGWAGFLTLNFGGPVQRGVFTQLADTDWQHDDGVGAFRVVVQTHFGAVDHDTFMHGIWQDQLLRNVQHGTGFWQVRVNAGLASSMFDRPSWYCAAKYSSGWELPSSTVTTWF
jgi:hypothetical protein